MSKPMGRPPGIMAKNALETAPTAGFPKRPPKTLGEHGRKLWNTVRAEYPNLVKSDAALLEAYCASYNSMVEMTLVLEREGHIVGAAHGPKPHPAFIVREKAAATMGSLSIKLGVAHSSRAFVERKADKPATKAKAKATGGIRLVG